MLLESPAVGIDCSFRSAPILFEVYEQRVGQTEMEVGMGPRDNKEGKGKTKWSSLAGSRKALIRDHPRGRLKLSDENLSCLATGGGSSVLETPRQERLTRFSRGLGLASSAGPLGKYSKGPHSLLCDIEEPHCAEEHLVAGQAFNFETHNG